MGDTYRKTATIEATQWFKMGDHPAVVMKSDPNRYADEGIPWCPTMEGGHVVTPGDWIATGIRGEHWPIKPDVFAETYTQVDTALSTPATEPQGLVENDTIDSFCLTLRRLVSDAYAERDRFGHIAATIRVNALHYGATNAEVEAMISGEISFVNWIADKVEALAARPAPQPAADTRVVSLEDLKNWRDRCAGALPKVADEIRAIIGTATPAQTYQSRVKPWLDACFGPEIAGDKTERNHRFLEEALELVQSGGCTASEAHQLVDYVYGRPVGEMGQEIGGVMNTLAALCLAYGRDMHEDGETELARVWTKVEKIRAKQAAKPKHSPLPEHTPAPVAENEGGV